MTLEQRVEALEMAFANMAAQQSNAEEITDIVRKATAGVIANARRPGGAINAAQKQTAYFRVGNGYVHITPTKIISLL